MDALSCRGLALVLAVAALGGAAPAAAQDAPSDFRLRATGALGYVVSADQHRLFALELPVLEGTVRAGWVVAPPVVLEVAAGAGAYFASGEDPGGLLDLTLGAEVGVDEGPVRLWLSAHGGVGVTGALPRPVLRIAIGVDLAVDPVVALGPTLGYAQVFQLDGPAQSDDAIALSIGLTVTIRPRVGAAPEEPVAPPSARPAPPARPPTPAPPAPPPMEEEVFVAMLDEAAGLAPRELLVPVLFAFDSTELVACTLPSLHALFEHLADHPSIRVLEIEGHADGQGDPAYNEALGRRRAEAIRDWLVERGIAPERLRVASRGEAAPIDANETEGGRTQNRRARFRVLLEDR